MVSEKSIAIAQQRFGDIAHIETYNGETLPFPNETFDIVFAACVFHHIPQTIIFHKHIIKIFFKKLNVSLTKWYFCYF